MAEEAPGAGAGKRSLAGFYAGVGAVVVLALVFACAWTPLRIWYWERQVRKPLPAGVSGPFLLVTSDGGIDATGPRTREARRLAAIGPAARPAFRRLLQADDRGVRVSALSGLGSPENRWALPLLVGAASDRDRFVAFAAISAAQSVTGRRFVPRRIDAEAVVDLGRPRLLDWWERRGRAGYGRGE